MALPPYCKETREPHTDRLFCEHCGTSDNQPLPTPFSAPSAIQPMVGDVRNAPIELGDSPVAIRTNPLFSSHRVAQTAKDLSGRKRSSRESIKTSFNAGAPPVSSRLAGARSSPDLQRYRISLHLIRQELISPEEEGDCVSFGKRERQGQ